MTRALTTVFYFLGAVGVGITGFHVLPALWNSNIIDCVVVGAALSVSTANMLARAFTGEFP